MVKRKRSSSDQDTVENRPSLRIITTTTCIPLHEDSAIAFLDELGNSSDSDYDSLFDDADAISLTCPIRDILNTSDDNITAPPARRLPPAIPGLYLDPSVLIPISVAEQLWKDCMRTFFSNGDVNQVMLFERARAMDVSSENDVNGSKFGKPRTSYLPRFLLDLLDTLKELLKAVLPPPVHALLFHLDNESHQARQMTLNHYRPGEGITPHVDLLSRYGDGIIGVSLHSGTVMDFTKVSRTDEQVNDYSKDSNGTCRPELTNSSHDFRSTTLQEEENNIGPQDSAPESYSVYLPERSIFVLSGEARYDWTHGIPLRTEDLVESLDGTPADLLPRGERLSITFRWLLPGADIVGN